MNAASDFHSPSTEPSLATRLKAKAQKLGFDLVGITGAEPSAFAPEYRDWVARGYAGEMEYLTRNPERRLDPRELLPDARSIIVVGMNYYTEGRDGREEGRGKREEGECAERTDGASGASPASRREGRTLGGEDREGPDEKAGDAFSLPSSLFPLPSEEGGVFARYARGEDYHDVMTARLRLLLDFLKAEAGSDVQGRIYVDTGPLLEREVAQRAGLGWFGKNTMLINTRRGSYFFLGEIVTNVVLPHDSPAVGGCGTCTRCLDACPTGAILEPYLLDARRCLSYLTIELKGQIPEELRPSLTDSGNRIYGCDICQEVCPFCQRRSTPTTEPAFQPRDITNAKLTDLLLMTQEEFQQKFKGSPVKRAKRRGLLRNVAVALAASDDPEAVVALEHALNDPEELVRDAARWALERVLQQSGIVGGKASGSRC